MLRIYHLIGNNDFANKTRKYLETNNIAVQTTVFLQLSSQSSKQVDHNQIYMDD